MRAMTNSRRWCGAVAIAVAAGASALVSSQEKPAVPGPDAQLRYAMLVTEDSRPVTRAAAEPLLRAVGHPAPEIARLAVRALGRLERGAFLPDILHAMNDSDALVRAEAANAIAQAAAGDPETAFSALRTRLDVERDPVARGALLDALGRLPFDTPAARVPVERILASALGGEFSPLPVRVGAARGLESLTRRALRAAALGTGRPSAAGDEVRVRRVAMLVLNAAGAADTTYERLAIDRDEQIRRLAVAGMAGSVPPELRDRIVLQGLRDQSLAVRYDALRVHARHAAASGCGPEIAALGDPNLHVALLAADLLATACAADSTATEALMAVVLPHAAAVAAARPARPAPSAAGSGSGSPPAAAPSDIGPWHLPAHALVSLARRAPGAARPLTSRLVAHPVWQARMYTARAAAAAADVETLASLVQDSNANVAAAAIDGLRQARGRDADPVVLAALARRDSQVIMAAARALEGTPARVAAAVGLLKTLDTLTAEKRDTSRDPRLALLERLREVGSADDAAALAPYTADFDPRIALRAAEILTAWTGDAQEIKTTRLATLPPPPREEIDGLPAGLRVTMANGRAFDIALWRADTPVTVWRIVRLVRQRYYDGLTFHRIVPNFVIQGGSPGADEYVGDGPFMRDELLGRSHDRGTVGVSTRGRDTGDAQFFVNLVDNPRLDHDYTIFGEIVGGMDVVDDIVEGDVMKTVELLPRLQGAAPPARQ
jgi:cyclophilin family peptidyl-prolyl cis-trans isomerase